MTIWCISKYASLPKYGTGARLFYLCSEFIKLGHDAHLITSDANHLANFPTTDRRYNDEIIDGVPVLWIKTKKYHKTASLSRVLSWLDFERLLFLLDTKKIKHPDIIIVSSLSLFTIIYGLFLKKKYKSFLVFEIRDIWPLTMTEEGKFSKWHPLVIFMTYIEKLGYKYSDLVVGTMPKLNLHVKNIIGNERPFFCSPLGYNPENYKAMNETFIPFRQVFPVDKIIIGYAGSMGITNALESFIESIKLLQNNKAIHFMLLGSGDLKNSYVNYLSECKNVTFLPRIAQNDVKYFLSQCDILYLSTKDSKIWEYGQSMNKIVEYMLAGKPILASYSGYPSMINESGCGYFLKTTQPTELVNAILKLTQKTICERKEMGQKGKIWIEKNRKYSDLAKLYLDAISQQKNKVI